MSVPRDSYSPGQVVPQTGIYRVVHKRHRAAHQNTLLRGMKFPRCRRCGASVRFISVANVPDFAATAIPRKTPALLLVDNEPVVAATLRWVLEQEGYHVSTAARCSRATGLLSSGEFDAVITEIDLEGDVRGIDLARTAMSLKPQPVVIISAAAPNEEKLRSLLGLRVDYLVLKPIDLNELKGALWRTLQHRAEALAY